MRTAVGPNDENTRVRLVIRRTCGLVDRLSAESVVIVRVSTGKLDVISRTYIIAVTRSRVYITRTRVYQYVHVVRHTGRPLTLTERRARARKSNRLNRDARNKRPTGTDGRRKYCRREPRCLGSDRRNGSFSPVQHAYTLFMYDQRLIEFRRRKTRF